MKVKFDLIRIGKIRKDHMSEILLKQNAFLLKNTIRHELADFESNEINIEMIIPAKGFNVKICLNNINDKSIKKYLRNNFSRNIYNGNYSVIKDNLNNPIFKN